MNALDLRRPARIFAPRVDAPEHLRAAAIATWHGRMINEYASSRVFTALAGQLACAGFEEDADEALQFAEEERRHGVLCGAVVEALGGEARGTLFEAPRFPEHRDAPPRAAVTRNVISICCMSETVAVALIGAERLEMPETIEAKPRASSDGGRGGEAPRVKNELRALLTRIWADEIGHARFGWRFLERMSRSLTREERDAIRAYLPIAFAHLESHEHAHLPPRDAPKGGESLGLCSGLDARVLLRETIDEVIAPRIQSLLG
jgi:hypothetical protein